MFSIWADDPNESDHPRIEILETDHQPRISLKLFQGDPSIALYDGKRHKQAYVGLEHGQPDFGVCGDGGHLRMALQNLDEGGLALLLSNLRVGALPGAVAGAAEGENTADQTPAADDARMLELYHQLPARTRPRLVQALAKVLSESAGSVRGGKRAAGGCCPGK